MSTEARVPAASSAENDDYQSLWANKYRGVSDGRIGIESSLLTVVGRRRGS